MKRAVQDARGFTLVEVLIVTMIIALLAAIAVPSFTRVRSRALRNSCIANLKQLDSAKEQWAMAGSKGVTDIPSYDDLDEYIRGDIRQMTCSAEKLSYEPGLRPIGISPLCPSADRFPEHFLPPKEE